MAKGADIENAYALIIGISEYKDPGIHRLNYTHADAESIFKLLTDPKNLGLSKDKIKILLDEDATLFKIKDAISNWLYKNADENSVVFIFFAGHGGVEDDPRGIEKDKLAKYLLPFDSVLDNLYASALSNRDFNDLLLTIRSKKLVIFMDSCYSGGVSKQDRDVKITDDPYKKLGEGEGRFVIAASQPNQRSYEDSRIEHGVFTHNLLEALSGKADLDNNGYVTVLDAWKYLEKAVPRDAMALAGGEQEPLFRGDMTRDFVISIDRERFEKIEKEEIIQRKISKLLELHNQDKLSSKQYAKLREIVKTDFEKLSDKDKNIVKLFDGFLLEYIPLTAFIEDLGIIEPELLSGKKRQEQERLRRQTEEEKAERKEKERKAKEEMERIAGEDTARREIEKQKEIREQAEKTAFGATASQYAAFGTTSSQYEGEKQKEIREQAEKAAFGATASQYEGEKQKEMQEQIEKDHTETPEIPETYTNSIGMKFVLIPAGEFIMGSEEFERTKPTHKVTIKKPFYLGVYPVTQREWTEVMEINSSDFKGDDLPVENVSWNDVQKFVKILNEKECTTKYRLPSEAEWEYAARAGTTTRYSFGDDESRLREYAWYYENSDGKTHSVGQKKPNQWGLYDMQGNVMEWLQDRYNDNYRGAPDDGSARESASCFMDIIVIARVVRGGWWYDSSRDCQSAFRTGALPFIHRSSIGFRLMKDL